MGLTGPSSLENVHWTFSQAFGPPKGKAFLSLAIPLPTAVERVGAGRLPSRICDGNLPVFIPEP